MTQMTQQQKENLFTSGYKFYIKLKGDKKFNNFDPIKQKIHINKVFHVFYTKEMAEKIFAELQKTKLTEEVIAIKLTDSKNKTIKSLIN